MAEGWGACECRGVGRGGLARGVCQPGVHRPRAFLIAAPPPRHCTTAHFLTRMGQINLFERGVLTSPLRTSLPGVAGPPLFLSRAEFTDPRPRCAPRPTPPAVFARTCWVGHAASPLLPCCRGDSVAPLLEPTQGCKVSLEGGLWSAGQRENLNVGGCRGTVRPCVASRRPAPPRPSFHPRPGSSPAPQPAITHTPAFPSPKSLSLAFLQPLPGLAHRFYSLQPSQLPQAHSPTSQTRQLGSAPPSRNLGVIKHNPCLLLPFPSLSQPFSWFTLSFPSLSGLS